MSQGVPDDLIPGDRLPAEPAPALRALHARVLTLWEHHKGMADQLKVLADRLADVIAAIERRG